MEHTARVQVCPDGAKPHFRFERISSDPARMQRLPCIRDTRVTRVTRARSWVSSLRMKLLVDENLSARVADILQDAGRGAVHVTAVGLGSTNDEAILRAAADDGSIIVTADADFGTLLAPRGATATSETPEYCSSHSSPTTIDVPTTWL